MIKCSLWVLGAISLISLAACSKNDTSVSLSASEIASSTALPASTSVSTQMLTSNDNKINIVVNGQYQNQLDSSSDWVEASEKSTLTLLQHNDSNNITLAVNNLGLAKLKPNDYFKNLAQALKNNTQLSDLKIGMATDNRMNYRFTHSVGTEILRENCIALMGGDNLYSVCASSDTADDEMLASALKNVSIQN